MEDFEFYRKRVNPRFLREKEFQFISNGDEFICFYMYPKYPDMILPRVFIGSRTRIVDEVALSASDVLARAQRIKETSNNEMQPTK